MTFDNGKRAVVALCALLMSAVAVSGRDSFEGQMLQVRQGLEREMQLQQLDFYFRKFIEELLVKAEPARTVAPLALLVSRQDPSEIYNAQWSSDIVRPLGGIPTFISAAFSRKPDGFLTVYPQYPDKTDQAGSQQISEPALPGGSRVPQEPPQLYHLRSLLNSNAKVEVNKTVYALSLSPRWPDKLASRVVFSRQGEKKQEVVLRDALKAVYAKGRPVNLSGTDYQFFYARDVEHDEKNKKVFFAKTETFFFITEVEKEDYKAFYIPVESVPSDGSIAYFKLYQDRPAGLRLIPKTAAVSAANAGPSVLPYLLEIYTP